jgi:excisionase family DNA binding protein
VDDLTHREWPDSMLGTYAEMLSVNDVAHALNVQEDTVRGLLTHPNPSNRLPGVKIGKSWRISRNQLCDYLIQHNNVGPSTEPIS